MTNAKKLPSGNWRIRVYNGKNKEGKNTYVSFTASTKKEAEFLGSDYLYNKNLHKNTNNLPLDISIKKYISDIKMFYHLLLLEVIV